MMGRRRSRKRGITRAKKICIITLALLVTLVCFYVYLRNKNTRSGSTSSAIPPTSKSASDTNKRESVTHFQKHDEFRNGTSLYGNEPPVFHHVQSFQVCDSNRFCHKGRLPFSIRALETPMPNASQFCIGGKRIAATPESSTLLKVVSVVVVHEVSQEVESVDHFDVSVDDKVIRDRLFQVPYYRLVFISSSGDVTKKISRETRALLSRHFHGSNDTTRFSTDFGSFIFVGQKGMQGKGAIMLTSNYSDVDQLMFAGCLDVPMGSLDPATPLPLPPAAVTRVSRFRRPGYSSFRKLPNCPRMQTCDGGNVSVILYSGKNKDEEPSVCVNGKVVIAKNVTVGGRGLNVVFFNSQTRQVTGVGHFDTYLEDSNQLEGVLQLVRNDELIIVVSSDEASRFLSPTAKFAFSELGSALIWDLKFRSSWYLIGQKGIRGFSPYEELNYAVGNTWAKPIDKQLCVPLILGDKKSLLKSSRRRNFEKRRFCDKYDGYEDFCEPERVDDILHPTMLHNRSLVNNPVFKVPLLVVGGLSQNSLRLCLETLVAQPGINPDLVLVCYDENYPEGGDLAELFHFRRKPISASASYTVQLAKAIDFVWSEYPNATAAIVIEEELLLAPDFLAYMAQMLPVLENDENLAAISGWNVNGFAKASFASDTAYRIEDFPGLAFMIRRSTYVMHMKGKMDQCCLNRAWEGWHLNSSARSSANRYQIIVPDMSRVARRHIDVLREFDERLDDYFYKERSQSSDKGSWISNVESLMSEHAYDGSVIDLLASAVKLNAGIIMDMCKNRSAVWDRLVSIAKLKTGQSVAVYFAAKPDFALLVRLRRCFGLFYHSSNYGGLHDAAWSRRGFYKGILRFSAPGGRLVCLVSPDSPFYQLQTTSSPGG